METRPFWKTSEFWMLGVGMNLLAIGSQLAEALPPKYGIPLMGLINIGYAVSRGMAKSGVAPTA